MEEFIYLGTALRKQNSIQEEIKSKLKKLYHWVQNTLSSSLLSKNLKMKIYRTIILPILCECETWSLNIERGMEAESVLKWGAEEKNWV